MQHDKIRLISNFGSYEGDFLGPLYDDGNFSKDKFHVFCETIHDLNKTDLNDSDRLGIVIKTWEVSFLIERFIGRHYNPDDFFEIKNISDDDIEQIGEIIYYVANWFSYNKKIEKEKLIIGSWSIWRSTLTGDAQSLLDNFHSGSVSSTEKVNDVKTRVDFGETIGSYVDPETGDAVETTVGIIHNSKKGAHIVPARPKKIDE